MNFRIGFPVDAGDPDLSFIILVRLCFAKVHTCKGGESSGLRLNSGAAFVFARVSQEISERYRFQFEPIPMPNPKTRPDNLVDVGYSDAVACAIAVHQYHPEDYKRQDAPIILISGSFAPQDKKHLLTDISIEKVSREDSIGESLYNKWQAACGCGARALILHEHDAKTLEKHIAIEVLELNANTRQVLSTATEKPYLISCKSNQYPLLAKTLGNNRPSNLLKSICFWVISAMLVALAVWGYSFAKNSKKLSFDSGKQKISAKRPTSINKHLAALIQEAGDKVDISVAHQPWHPDKILLKKFRQIIAKKQCYPTIIHFLKNQNWRYTVIACYLLREIELPPAAVKELLAVIPKNYYIRPTAVATLGNKKPSLLQILKFLDKQKDQQLTQAFTDVVRFCEVSKADAEQLIPIVKSIVESKNKSFSIATLIALRPIARDLNALAPTLVKQLSDFSYFSGVVAELLTLMGEGIDKELIAQLDIDNTPSVLVEILYYRNIRDISIVRPLLSRQKPLSDYTAKVILAVGPSAIPILLDLLEKRPSKYTWTTVWKILSDISITPAAEKFIPQFLTLLQDPNIEIQNKKTIIRILGKIGPKAASAVPLVVFFLKNAYCQEEVLKTLAQIGPKAEFAATKVIRLLAAPESLAEPVFTIWDTGTKVLNQITVNKKDLFLEALNHPNQYIKIIIIRALQHMGPRAKSWLPHLRKLLAQTNNTYMKASLICTISEIAGTKVKAIDDILKTTDSQLLLHTLRFCRKAYLGKKQLAILKQLQNHKEGQVRVLVAVLIAQMENTTESLLRAYYDRDTYVKIDIEEELQQMGPDIFPVVLEVLDDLNDPYTMLENILKDIDSNHKKYLPALANIMKRSRPRIKKLIIQALGKLGRDAKKEIVKELNNADDSVQIIAMKTLDKLGDLSLLEKGKIREIAYKNSSWKVRLVAYKILFPQDNDK